MLFPGLVLLAIGCTSPALQSVPQTKTAAAACEHSAVKVITHKEGNTLHFLVDNRELCEVTMSFEMGLVHLKPSVQLPYTASFPPGQVTEAFSITPTEPSAKWSFTYTNYFKLGSNCARHDDHCTYELPYGPEEKLEVTQGYNGCFSHKGANQYAIDWQMPVGSVVRATRGGLVVRTKDDSDRAGASMDFDRFNNYVLIRHDDGTLGQYCHLQKGGVLVKPGQIVAPGEPIAHSGNTGFSTGPHLHFCVFMTKSGYERVSIPVKFRTSEGPALTLVSGHTYQAANLGPALAKAPAATPRSKAVTATGAAGASAQ
ncbi:MAG TPA: M23 family metallopeptidase [Bacillota bacterium]|nr:M23 family metallopeptidase [Bacillota bacterium]